MGENVCRDFSQFRRTTCVEVFTDSKSDGEVAWGSHDYWQVVFRKHVVLTAIAVSNISKGVIYTDPDIVYLDSPVGPLARLAEVNDITFSPNNMLELDAKSVEDIAEVYETRGMESIVLGPHRRRADINTGLFHMRSSDAVVEWMLKSMEIFKQQEFVHGHYQQFSMVEAMQNVRKLKIGVAPGDVLVNGNVFWGHRNVLTPTRVVSVHANWTPGELKRACLESAGFWILTAGPIEIKKRLSISWDRFTSSMDDEGKAVVSCRGKKG